MTSLLQVRLEKLQKLRELGVEPYCSDFVPNTSIAEFNHRFVDATEDKAHSVFQIAGRIMHLNWMGKAAFCRIQDTTGQQVATGQAQAYRLQIYLRQNELGEQWQLLKLCDLGDFIGVVGTMMRTKTGELTLHASALRLLSKSVRPLPEKWHGLSDVETRYRQRYLDCLVNAEVRTLFYQRAHIVRLLREFLQNLGFLEVETPMLHSLYGGAAAKPFVTHHNALAHDFYLRIAPELYLKRLLVGGFAKVFEIGRNFRNEGVSVRHNPEFTMLEYYAAYHSLEDVMAWTEDLLRQLQQAVTQDTQLPGFGTPFGFLKPFRRVRMVEAVAEFAQCSEAVVLEDASRRALMLQHGLQPEATMGFGQEIELLFGHLVEPHLISPTFVYDFPTDISPLSKARGDDPRFAERFELYVAGMELANAFNELNDPIEQRVRFVQQLGGAQAHRLDEDYIKALEYGMPPAAGFGMGIDRLVMLLLGQTSIREVILFPLLRPH